MPSIGLYGRFSFTSKVESSIALNGWRLSTLPLNIQAPGLATAFIYYAVKTVFNIRCCHSSSLPSGKQGSS